MKIGVFSESNQVSIDTVRHYMELGLIIPEKKGGQYFFDQRCQQDLADVIYFKGLGFTLKEIQSIFSFKRLGRLTPYQQDQYYRAIFLDKQEQLKQDLARLSMTEQRLQKKIEELSKLNNQEASKMGIRIDLLGLFRCCNCAGKLILAEGAVEDNQLLNGIFQCSCGMEYVIDDGILMVDRFTGEGVEQPEHIIDYINTTSDEYLDKLYQGLEWTYKKLDFNSLTGKVLLELGSGFGYFLRHIYQDIPPDTIYLAVDHDLKKQRFLKRILEGTGLHRQIIFICSDFRKVPISEQVVDILIDFSGSSNYSFEHEEFLLEVIERYTKNDTMLIGSYILFKKFVENSFIPAKERKNFQLDFIKGKIQELNYKIIEQWISNAVRTGGRYENYFQEGEEEVYSFVLLAQR